ncbi:MAG TPA: hypothetical protein VK534_00945 [Methylomirabilota bacterium]|nr:hypothetical protein [Methylomirabilota bacterium]
MSNIERGFCNLEEYRAGVPNRVMPDQLAIGGLYVIIFALQAEQPREAMKLVAQIRDVDPLNEWHHNVEFEIQNVKLKNVVASSVMKDGMWLNRTPSAINITNGNDLKIPIVSGYFKETSGEGSDSDPNAGTSVQLPVVLPRLPQLV